MTMMPLLHYHQMTDITSEKVDMDNFLPQTL